MDRQCDGCSGVGKITVSISRSGKVKFATCTDCGGSGKQS